MTLSIAARIRLVQGLFFVSGFCGLIYESIWSHYLKLFLGHAAYAQSVVLVVFIGGMAIGAALAGRYASSIRRPLLAYAAAELAVGVFGLAFHRVFVASTDWAYASLLPATCSPDAWCVSSWLLAALLILPQSVLLGTTFPLMTSGLLRLAPRDPGRRIALLYFLNSIGAVFGVLACAFIVIPRVGLPGANAVAGTLNVLLAAAVYVIARMGDRPGAHADAAGAVRAPGRNRATVLFAVAALTGLSSFGYEIAWIRMLSQALGSSTHAFELMLASFILGLALGGAWIRKRIDRIRAPVAFLAVVQIAMGLAALASIVLYDRAFDAMAWLVAALAKTDGGYVLFNVGSAAIAMAIMLPATFAAGMTLPLITYVLIAERYGERAIGYVYAWNTLGAIAGVLAAVHFGLPGLGVAGTLIAAAGIDVALGLFLLGKPKQAPARAGAAALALLALVATASAPWWATIDPMKSLAGVYRTGVAALREGSEVLYDRDGKTASVSVTRTLGNIVTIRTNGKPDASANLPPDGDRDWVMEDEVTMVLSAALPLARNPGARDVAVIGFGSGMTTAAFLDVPTLRRVDTIEIEPAMIEGARHFMPLVRGAFEDPRAHSIVDDAKSYFAKAGRRYDIIVSEPSNPWVAGVSSLFTEEFYRQAYRYLNPGGVLAQWIQAYEFDQRLLASIVRAVLTVFPDATLYSTNGVDLILVATRGDAGPGDAARLFAHPAFAARLASVGIESAADLDRRRIVGPARIGILFAGIDAPPNSDFHPFVDVGASAARFKGSVAEETTTLVHAPVPVMDLIEGHGPPSAPPPLPPPTVGRLAERWADARIAHEYVVGRGFAQGTETPDVRSAESIVTARMALVDCVSPASALAAWDAVVTLAGDFATLPAADMDRFVETIERSRCRASLPESAADWMRLFRAIGRRDAAAAAAAAAGLLAREDLTTVQREFATFAATAGYLGSNRKELARRTFDENDERLGPAARSSAWHRLLSNAVRP